MTYTDGGQTLKEFRAVCPVSKFMVTRVYSRATAGNAKRFLMDLLGALPFPLLSVQVDGGSEFMAGFEDACEERRVPLHVLPPRNEGSPNVLIQAMACGTPVVSTDCRSGPSEILEDGRWGRLVPVGDPQALSVAIIDGLDNPCDSAALMVRAGDFSAERSIDAYLELVSTAASGVA